MKIKEIDAKKIFNSRNEKTIEVLVKNNLGVFSASSPSGKSKGKYEKPSFIGSIEKDISMIKNIKFEFDIDSFNDLVKVEDILLGKIGANSLFSLETAILKALALEQNKKLWQVLNEKAKRMPFPVGNCIGGGVHTKTLNFLKPDFQEFLIIPRSENFSDNVFLMNKAWELCRKRLKFGKVLGNLNDENAFSTSLNNEEVLEILNKTREELENETEKKIEIGVDVASSTFYSNVYNYKNPAKKLKADEQKNYIKSLIENFRLGYVEDPFYEEDFDNFASLKKELTRGCFIAGDDLIASQLERLKKAILKKSVSAVIVKPNQIGSLIEIKKLVELAKKYEIATIMSHRSGETSDYALADLCFGLQTELIKTGIKGKEREIKLNRLIEIEKNLW